MTTRTGDAARVTLAHVAANYPDATAWFIANRADLAHTAWRAASVRVGFTIGAHEERVGRLLHRYYRALGAVEVASVIRDSFGEAP